MSLWNLQDSQHVPFVLTSMLGRADLYTSYILRLVCPLLVAADCHFRGSPSPTSCIVAEMTTLFKWLIRYPEFVPDSNFIQGCLTMALADLELTEGR